MQRSGAERLDMSGSGAKRLNNIKDEEDGTPIGCVLIIEAMILIRL
jgi:hypothetical protein